MSENTRPIEVGDRFETKDGRDVGRVVEVTEALGLSESATRHLAQVGVSSDHAERVRLRKTFFRVSTEAHPRNPDAIGNVSRVSEKTLRTKYRRISR